MKKEVLLKNLEKELNLVSVVSTGLLLIFLIDIVDYITDPRLDFSLFYLTPVLFCTWFGGRRLGSLMAFLSAISWLVTERWVGTMEPDYLLFYYWDCFTRLSFYWVVAQLLASVRERLSIQKKLARTDNVTGSANARHFRELLTAEIQRFDRYHHPSTLVYFDLDNFKHINDTLGHAIGDQVLQTIAQTASQQLRSSDSVARLGGDEFGILMPETSDTQALAVMQRLHTALVKAMEAHHWPVTCSMGGISCVKDAPDVSTLIRLADHLMYQVKHEGKNGIRHMVSHEAQATLSINPQKSLI